MPSRLPISSQYDLRYHRRVSRWRWWKRCANVLGVVAAVAVCIYWWARGDSRIYQSHPVTAQHADFAHDCSACHTKTWQPAMRLFTVGEAHRSVTDDACLKCHQAELGSDYHSGDHHVALLGGSHHRFACADCHREHRADGTLLTRVDDRFCIDCHRDLPAVMKAPSQVADGIRAFDATHPTFAWETQSERRDHGGVKFNHAHHLNHDKVKKSLHCADCHQPTDDGRTMKPVQYEHHCAECHPLRLGDDPAALDPLPHGDPDLVIAALRARVALREAIGGDSKHTDDDRPPLISPLLDEPVVDAPSKAAIAHAGNDAVHALFGPEAKGHCRKCHHVVAQGQHWKILNADLSINRQAAVFTSATDDPIMPHRWLQHARFDHGRHQTEECSTCHQVSGSEKTSDILMPPMQTCLKCHDAAAHSSVANFARGSCVTCHSYHDETWERAPVVSDRTDLEALSEYLRTSAPESGEATP